MKKRFLYFLFAIIGFLLVFPIVLEKLYKIGERYPIIILSYSQSDVLNYISSIIAILLAVFAIFLEESSKDIKIEFSKTLQQTQSGTEYMEIYTRGPSFRIKSIMLSTKKGVGDEYIFCGGTPLTVNVGDCGIVEKKKGEFKEIINRHIEKNGSTKCKNIYLKIEFLSGETEKVIKFKQFHNYIKENEHELQ